MKDLEKAKELLKKEGYTCVVVKENAVVTSFERGIKPLVKWYDDNLDFDGFSAADKVVGKATAYLYVLLKVRSVFADVMSKSALKVLEMSGINAFYGELVDNIINRAGNGICPFEKAVLNVCNKNDAYTVIRKKMEEMDISL